MQLNYIIRYGMKPEYMLCLLINLSLIHIYPKLEDLHNIGTVGRIVRILEMPDQTTTVILQGMKRLSLTSIIETHPYRCV